MQFQFFSVYCLFFFACKDTMRSDGGLGNRGTSLGRKRLTGKYCAEGKKKMPNSIRQNGRSLISFLYGRLRGAVFKWDSDDIKTDAAKGMPIGNRRKTKKQRRADARRTWQRKIHTDKDAGMWWGGIGQQLSTISQQFLVLYPFFYRRLWRAVSELNSDAMNKVADCRNKAAKGTCSAFRCIAAGSSPPRWTFYDLFSLYADLGRCRWCRCAL